MNATPAETLLMRIREGHARRDDLFAALLASMPDAHHAQLLSILDSGTESLLRSGRVTVSGGVYGVGAARA